MPADGPTRRLAAILAADVEGYSRLMGVDEAATLQCLSAYRSIIDEHVAKHHGRVVGSAGDSLLVEFASAIAAVNAAVAIQTTLAERNAALAEDRRMRFRIGINLGDVLISGDDIHGDGVNVAARIEKLAPAGGICVSRSVHDQVEGKVACRFTALGEHTVKNIAKPVRVFRVEIESGPASSVTSRHDDKASVAILPFANMSGDPEQEYFSDGVTEDIITELSRFHELLVTARNSSFVFKGKNVDIKDAAGKLGVHYVVEGSVRKAGNRVRITAQLIDAETTKHVWAERYDRDLADIFEVQEEVARTVATTVAGRVMAADTARAHRRPTESLSAYDNYLRAREFHGGYDRVSKSEPFLLRAIELDPRFAMAHALLSTVYVVKYLFDGNKGHLDQAEAWGRRAIVLDGSEARCHLAIGHPLIFQGRLDEAGAYLERAVSYNSNDTIILMIHAMWLSYMGRHKEALAGMAEVFRRDPMPLDWYWDVLGGAQIAAGHYAEAIASYQRMVEIPPWGVGYLAICHFCLGQMDDARACAARYVAEYGNRASVEYFLESEPQRDPEVIARFRSALLALGIPERPASA